MYRWQCMNTIFINCLICLHVSGNLCGEFLQTVDEIDSQRNMNYFATVTISFKIVFADECLQRYSLCRAWPLDPIPVSLNQHNDTKYAQRMIYYFSYWINIGIHTNYWIYTFSTQTIDHTEIQYHIKCMHLQHFAIPHFKWRLTICFCPLLEASHKTH